MRFSRTRNLVLTGLIGVHLLNVQAQQVPDLVPAPATPTPPVAAAPETGAAPNLFPTAPTTGATPDFSGTNAVPASAFGAVPDFSRGTSGAPTAAPTGGSASPGAPGSATGFGGTPATGGAPRSGFVPGPYSSPASTTPTTPNGVAAPASVFGTTTLGTGTGLGAGSGTGTAGLGGANTRTPQPSTASSFTLPGAYGQAPLTFSAGQGRLARPRYVYTGTLQFGYDDNVLQTPTSQIGLPAVTQLVETQPAIPEQTVQVLIPQGKPSIGFNRPPLVKTVVVQKGQPAVVERVLVSPAVPVQPRVGSFEARSGVGFEMQLSNSRTVFTADAHVNYDYYFNRPDDKSDFNGNIALIYAHRYSARTQFSATVTAAYLSQPDLRVVSGPTRQVGDYLSFSSKFDLTYQWSKRVSTVTSLSLTALEYMNQVQKLNDTYGATLGTEARYTSSARLTTVAEARVEQTFYPNGSDRDSSTYFLLVGADYAYSRRLSGTIRVGEALRSFAAGGGVKSSPYLEATAAYRYSSTGSLSFNTRYGFEEPQDATSEVIVLRASLSAVQAFTSRLRGSASIGFIHHATTENSTGGVSDITEDTYSVDLGLDYALTKKFSINASYSYINDLSNLESAGYYRNQIFFGGQYTY